MRIVLVSYWFPKGMGYLANILPRYLARAGADVHFLTMDLPVYFYSSASRTAHSGFEGQAVLAPGTVERYDGFTLHWMGHRKVLGYPRFVGLQDKLRKLKPDVVQSMLAIGWVPLDAARLRRELDFRLFTAAHTHASVFPMATEALRLWKPRHLAGVASRWVPGRYVSWHTEKCYAISPDCADIAIRFFGVEERKVVLSHLGVDTDLFFPARTQSDLALRSALRAQWGAAETDLVCIYTGQFTPGKNPLLLARAVAALAARGLTVKGVFVGAGEQQREIESSPACSVVPFLPHRQLGGYYRAADIAVWPTQESTSMLDAAACGVPIIVNNTVQAPERTEGNGLTYRLNDVADLVRAVASLADRSRREAMGRIGAERMAARFGYTELARRRLADYESAIAQRGRQATDTEAPQGSMRE